MWVIHACLSSIQASRAPCDPTSWADLGEMFLVALGAVLFLPALGLLLAWLGSLF